MRRQIRANIVATGILFIFATGAVRDIAAQAPAAGSTATPDSALKFDVASIKPNVAGVTSYLWQFRGERFTVRYATLKSLIAAAYGAQEQALTDRQIIGGPKWIEVDRFDVEATAPGTRESPRGTFTPQMLAMLRNLIDERFHLETHFDQRELQTYALVLARRDGMLGPGLRRRSVDCTPSSPRDPNALPLPRALGAHQTCGGRVMPGTMIATGATMTNLVSGIARLIPGVDRVVIDRTGLTGTFDVDLTWAPETISSGDGTSPVAVTHSNAPSFFTALQEQLGLKLESTKKPTNVLVIDRVERLTQD